MLLGVIEYTEAKRIRNRLEEIGVGVDLRSNPDTCATGGCSPSVEVHIDEADLVKVQEFLKAERVRDLGEAMEGFNAAQVTQVFDTSKDEAICPACGTQFKTSARECPDCGLVFAVPEQGPED